MTTAPRFDLGAHTLIYSQEPFDRALSGIAAAGFAAVGLWLEHAGAPLLPPRPDPAEVADLRDRITGYGLTPVTMFARAGATVDFGAMLADLDLCAALGMPLLQAAGPWPFVADHGRKPEMAWYGEVEHFLALLERAGPAAIERGVTIVLKPHRGATATGADLLDVIRRVGSVAVRACWDAGNVHYYEGIDPGEDLESSGVAPFVRSVCIKDHAGPVEHPHFPIPGDGDIDHVRLLSILAAQGFRGPLLVERVDQPDAAASDKALVRAHSFLTSTIAQVTGGQPA